MRDKIVHTNDEISARLTATKLIKKVEYQ